MGGIGVALREMGERRKDSALVTQAITALRAALKVELEVKSPNLKYQWNNLDIALQALGKLATDAAALREAEEAQAMALALRDKVQEPLDWESSQNNLALAQGWLGAVTGDGAKLQEARDGYAACEALTFEGDAPFDWARLQWNIADLALARYRLAPDPVLLVEARSYVARARAFFVDGSDHQTERCDALLAEIDAAGV